MIVKQAKEIARMWVEEEGIKLPGFYGAFYHGSINWLSEKDYLPSASDVDVMVVLDGPIPPTKLGKFLSRGVLLEVSYLSRESLSSVEQVLEWYPIAGSFQKPGIIRDDSGWLSELQKGVAREYARRYWVHRRCERARENVLNSLQRLRTPGPFHDLATAWLFAAGITTHILLVAGLRNPTVRTRYVAVRKLLRDYGFPDFYEPLLEMLGCAQMNREEVERHLVTLGEVFDAAKTVVKPSYPFAADLTDIARPVVIDGSREMIERGDHREAIFWMVATYSRCQSVLYQWAPEEVLEHFNESYRRLLGDLGIRSVEDLQERGEQIREFLPRVWEVAEEILAANKAIE